MAVNKTEDTVSEIMTRKSSIWLEVTNVRLNGSAVEILVKGDKADNEPVWRRVDSDIGLGDASASYRAITDGLDKKRIVIAQLQARNGTLHCPSIRIQYAESNTR